MPDYVAVLASDVVNGNPANANYQGQPLGEPGGPGDRPVAGRGTWRISWKVVLRHGPARRRVGTTYSAVAGSLFGDNPNPALDVPSSADMGQGGSAIAISLPPWVRWRTARLRPSRTCSSPTAWRTASQLDGALLLPHAAGIHGRLRDGQRSVAGYLTGSGIRAAGPDGSWWMPLLEKAYAAVERDGQGGPRRPELLRESHRRLDAERGCAGPRPAPTTFCPASDAATKQALIDACESSAAVTAAIFGDDTLFNALGLVSGHAYEVVGYDADPVSPTFDTFQLKNPWGFDEPAPLTWDDLCAYCAGWPWPTQGRHRRKLPGRGAVERGGPCRGPEGGGRAAIRPGCGVLGEHRGQCKFRCPGYYAGRRNSRFGDGPCGIRPVAEVRSDVERNSPGISLVHEKPEDRRTLGSSLCYEVCHDPITLLAILEDTIEIYSGRGCANPQKTRVNMAVSSPA